MAESKIIVVSFMSPGVPAGGDGFVIINGKLRRVPPHSPKLKELQAALTVKALEETITDKRMRSQLADLADSLISASATSLAEEAGK